MNAPATAAELQSAVRELRRVRVRAGGSKDALSHGATLDVSRLAGMLAYEPQEYTFTARAGTPLAEVERLLAEQGQVLPFDPPFAAAGATLGGTVAAGLSGPGRYRYGGVRDFLLGVTFVDGTGALQAGGGRVVKNAAGFDFPKLMVGGLGRFGVLTELTFKVFPRPEAFATLRLCLASFEAAVAALHRVALSSFEPACLELEPPAILTIRLGGRAEALAGRLERLRASLAVAGTAVAGAAPGGAAPEGEVLEGAEEQALWDAARAFGWVPDGHALVKVPLDPSRLLAFERCVTGTGFDPPRRYGVGGNVAYLAWPESGSKVELERILAVGPAPSGLALTGRWPEPRLGPCPGGAFLERVARVLDPEGKFGGPTEVHGAA